MRQKQELALVDLAIQQNNVSVAGKFLQKTKHVISFLQILLEFD
jgi:flagellin-specific chaperone FliS